MKSMTRAIIRTTILFVTVFGFAACGDDMLTPEPAGGLLDGSVTMQIDGTPWSATFATATNTGGIVGLGAGDTQGTAFGLAFVGSTTGTYSVGPTLANNATFSEGSLAWTAVTNQGSGTINVTTLTANRVAGTFTFEVVAVGTHTPATRSLTSGTFDLPIS